VVVRNKGSAFGYFRGDKPEFGIGLGLGGVALKREEKDGQ
jgi:hypothetical protein